GAHDARQRGAVGELRERGVGADLAHQRLVGDDEPRHAHAGRRVRRDAPEVRTDLLDAHRPPRGSARRHRRGAMPRPREADHGHEHAEHARELRHAKVAEPEAVEPQRLDGEAPDRVEADVAEEERARVLAQRRAQPADQRDEDGEVPDRLVQERRVEVLELPEARRPMRGRDVELPRHVGRPTDVAWKLYISPAHRPPGFGQFEYFHPTFLYESIWDFAVFVALVSWLRPSLRQYPGALFFCYIGLYSIGRFAIEALRLDSFWLGNFRVPQLA